ncbi:MAG: YggS family pyridoxal phosphate-dependent enzyme [Terriglobia bacterium]
MKPAGTVSLSANLGRIQERMAAACRRVGRSGPVTLVAVSKTVPAERIAEAYRAGVRHFGENRVQEFEEKHRLLTLPSALWHLVGHLQTNKAKRAVELFERVDSVDSLRLAEKLAAAARAAGRTLPVLLQVRLGEEQTKHGVRPEELPALAERIASLSSLGVKGLMALPPFREDPEEVRPYFRRLRELADSLAGRCMPGVGMGVLSMGMSHDFEVAIEEGATEVRLGTALFGPRPLP